MNKLERRAFEQFAKSEHGKNLTNLYNDLAKENQSAKNKYLKEKRKLIIIIIASCILGVVMGFLVNHLTR